MRFLVKGIAAGLMLTAGSGFADAAFVVGDDAVFGIASVFRDTQTNLEWLKLPNSTGFTNAGVVGPQFAGWTAATQDQVATLWGNAGISFSLSDNSRTYTAENYAPISALQAFLGVTASFLDTGVPTNFSGGFVGPLAPNDFRQAMYLFSTPTAGAYDPGIGLGPYGPFQSVGYYLNRSLTPAPVPEPMSLTLFGISLIGLCVARCRMA